MVSNPKRFSLLTFHWVVMVLLASLMFPGTHTALLF